MKKTSLTVILPTLNEVDNLKPLVEEIIRIINPAEIIIVDDSSSDGTVDLAKKLEVRFSNVKAFINRPAKGLAKSIQKGIDISTSAKIAWMDADFSHPPEVLKGMLKKIKTSDIVVGSWLVKGGKDNRKEKFTNMMSLVINRVCQQLFNGIITTYTSGFILIKKNALYNFKLKGDYGEYFIDLLVRKSAEGKILIEVPFICLSRRKGKSKTTPNPLIYLKRGINYLRMIYSLRRYMFKQY